MKTRKVSIIFLSTIVFIVVFGIIISDTIACNNGPNYWGMGYPGNVETTDGYSHPKKPSDYIFGRSDIPGAQGYDGSHYGTHDWIADAALRTLRDVTKNPSFFSDWTWLINSDIARNKWPAWKANYRTPSNHHNVIRGYFTFLFATQMPDMKKVEYPDIQEIYIQDENAWVKDLERWGGKWVGQKKDHFHFKEINISDNVYVFALEDPACIKKITLVGGEAINSIGNAKIDEDGNRVSAMQPEAAAGWLGAMTHYIADLLVPAHVLKSSTHEHVYLKTMYHTWFENQLASLTKWDKSYGSNGGPESCFFSWDTYKAILGPIIPIPPNLAATFMALTTINTAFRTDGHHQHVPLIGNNLVEAENSGLYLNNTPYSSDVYWDWKEDIATNGRENSVHRLFYDKVEKLLAWSVYYSACAMQYCYNKGREKNNNESPNSNYFVENPIRTDTKTIPTKKDEIQSSINDLSNLTPDTEERNRFIRNFKNFSKILASIALWGIQDNLRKLMKIL